MKFIYTDIDYVLSLATETKYYDTKWGKIQKFNSKAVNIYNQILKETNALPIITSDWRFKFTLSQLQEIFKEWALIETLPIDTIPEISNTIGMNNDELRANEILLHIKKYNPKSWVVIDDINLSKWIDKDHFVHLSRPSEGIKQTGKFKEIIKKLNN
ncbi:HAD domain-containing protein [bacterium]|jgi:hypothetical protein|nr:HAD domain-containing protein [bacterium]